MHYAQAITVLRKMQSAAPPTAAARLGDVVELLIALYDENAALKNQPAPLPAPLVTGVLSDPVGTGVLPPLPSPPAESLLPQTVEVLLPALTVLRGQIAAVRTGRLGRVNAEQDGVLLLAEQQAEAAFAMIDSLDMLTKLRTGSLDVQLEPVDVESVIQTVWQRTHEKAAARGHRVSVRLDDPLPAVVGDRSHVVTILCDLLENAILYTPYGGVIRLTADTLGTHVLIGVEDNGVGLMSNDQVGEAFWRGIAHALVRQHSGAGLRLYLARQLLPLMDGELFFSGEAGEGSTFSFTLPAMR